MPISAMKNPNYQMPSNAFYEPPSHIHISDRNTDFEKFIHNVTVCVPVLIRVAMIHYSLKVSIRF